jgi:hypothetical protein
VRNRAWMDFLLNVAATFIGALLALISGWLLSRADRVRHERSAIQACINDIHRRRVYRPFTASALATPLAASVRDDLDRCNQSVLASRTQLARTMDSLPVGHRAATSLTSMHGACSRYLTAVERQEELFWVLLMDLRQALLDGISGLAVTDPKLDPKEPGMGEVA